MPKRDRPSSYQRQKRRILFYKERGEDLEKIIHALCRQINGLGESPRIPLTGGVAGNRVLNDISSGDFGMMLSTKYHLLKLK